MALVAGVDSSTQACKIVIRDSETGDLVRSGRAVHPHGTEVDPDAWWTALQKAIEEAGGIEDVSSLAVGGQQHGMVCNPINVVDRLSAQLTSAARRQRTDPTAFIAQLDLFGDLVDDQRFVTAYTSALNSLHSDGASRTVAAAG
jgi:hypothetical protein